MSSIEQFSPDMTYKSLSALTLILISGAMLGSCDLTALLSSAPDSHTDLVLKNTEGKLPTWLKGTLYRAGPGLFEHGGRSVNGICDGLAKVHGWNFRDGKVKYSSEMVPSHVYNQTMDEKVLAPSAVIGDITPDLTLAEEINIMMSSFDKKDNANIAIWDLEEGRSVVVTAESPMMQQLQPKSLKYRGPLLSGAINKLGWRKKPMFSATHFAKHTSGSSFNYILTMSVLPWEMKDVSYEFFEYIPGKEGEVETKKVGSVTQPMTDMRLLHMFGATENFIVVPLWNFQFIPQSLFHVLRDMTHLCHSIRFAYENPFYIHVLSLRNKKTYKFELPPARGVHVMNSFERTNSKGEVEVVMDAPTTSNIHEIDLNKACLFDVMKIPNMKDTDYLYKNVPWNTTLRRYVLNTNTLEYSIEEFPRIWDPVDAMVEFPFVNPAYLGRKYCFCYFQQWQMSTNNMNLLKYDLCKKTAKSWHEENKHVMEPVFAANPKPSSEDDGVIMAPVYDSKDGTTEMIVWDAKDLKVIARFDNLVKVPFTIHGWWFNE